MADKNIQLMSENGVDNLFPVTKWFIDTSNIIASQSSSSTSVSVNYTATQDCIVEIATSNNTRILVDGIEVSYFYVNISGARTTCAVQLKKGQTITTNSNVYSYNVFGLK